MPSDLREHDLRAFLGRMAGEMPVPEEVPPRAVRRAHTRLVRTTVAAVLGAVLVVVGSVSGLRSLIRAEPNRPADETPLPPIVAIPVEFGVPRDLAVGAGSVWVSGSGVFRIDPATADIVAAFPSEQKPVGRSSIVATSEDVWVSGGAFDGEILRIDPATNEIVATLHTGTYEDPYALAVGADAVWATTHTDAALLRIDPATNGVEAITIPGIVLGPEATHPGIHGVAVLDGVVWVTASTWDDGTGELYGIDAESLSLVSKIGERWLYDGVWAGFGSLWAVASPSGEVVRVDPVTGSVLARIDIGVVKRVTGTPQKQSVRIAIGEGSVWVADGSRFICRIDPATNEIVATLALAGPVEGLTAGEGAIWVADGRDTVYRIDPSAFIPVDGEGS